MSTPMLANQPRLLRAGDAMVGAIRQRRPVLSGAVRGGLALRIATPRAAVTRRISEFRAVALARNLSDCA